MQKPMPIIVGAPRSGTTLLRFMLDSHPELAIPPETGFLALFPHFKSQGDELREEFFRAIVNFPTDAPAWADFEIPEDAFREKLMKIDPFTVTEGYRAFYSSYACRFAKARWGDKTPDNSHHMHAIEAALPEAHFIHIIRDGRDVALSLRQTWFSPGREIETLARHWSDFVTSARTRGVDCRRYLEVRYEELILSTRKTLEKVCSFVDLAYDEAMLSYHRRTPHRLKEHKARYRNDGTLVVSEEQRFRQQLATTQPPDHRRVFGWRQAMSPEERAGFETVAGQLLRELDYDTVR